MRIAYFVNQYPAVSHTFIRREIRAMESLGVVVSRFALRLDPKIVDEEDEVEAKRTRLVLNAGIAEFCNCWARILLSRPLTTISVIAEALRMGWYSESGIFRHLAYVLEAAVLADWCRRDNIEHIHAHFGTNSAAIAMFACRFSKIPFSFTAHGSEEFIKAPLLALDRKLQRARFAVCVSSFGRSQLMRWSAANQWQKIALAHCGLDSKFFNAAVVQPPLSPRLVCVGRMDENKGHIVLVAAVRRLQEEGIRCEIVLAGDGPLRPDVEEAIRTAGLDASIILTGRISGTRVIEEINAARALVLPSFCENMPVVIMEAMALARPVVATYVGGIPELVQSGTTGWLVPAGDEVALAQAMREALMAPVEQLAGMGSAGRHHIIEHNDALKEAKKLKILFERAL